MKKSKRLSLILLCASLLLQVILLPASATETTTQTTVPQTTQATQPVVTPTTAEAEFGTVCVLNGCRTIEGMVPLAGTERVLDTALGAFLYEVNTDTVVYSYNPDQKLACGSLTKIVTAIVALQYCNLDDVVTVESGIKARLPVSSLTIGLTSEEQISVRDLLYALLMTSANDAAVVLAEHISGNRQGFVPLMNQWVQQIGCTNTEFGTVHGVDGGLSSTTARDMVKIIRGATKNEDFVEFFGKETYDIPATNKSEQRDLTTTNYMRYDAVLPQFYDRRVTGGIQSYETSSGACLAVTANYNDMNYIGVVLGCTRVMDAEDTWRPTTYGNFEEMIELLKLGFDNFKVNRIVYDGMTLSQIAVAGGECNAVAQTQVDIDSVVPAKAQVKNLTITIKPKDEGLSAPIKAGEQIGVVEIWYRNSCMAEAEIYSMGNVKAADDKSIEIHSAVARNGLNESGIFSIIGTICVIVLGLAAAYLAFNAYMRSRLRARRRRRRANRRRIR